MVKTKIEGRVIITEFLNRHDNIAARCKEMLVDNFSNERILEVEVYSLAGVEEAIKWLSQFRVVES
jgi:hypothetical protein